MNWAGALLLALSVTTGDATAEGPEWQKDLATANTLAEKSGKPLFLVFT